MKRYTLLLIFPLLWACGGKVVTSVDEKGRTVKKELNKAGLLDGMLLITGKDGKLLERAHYKEDSLHGLREIFFPGTEKVEIAEHYDNNVFHGPYKVYYPNGTLRLEAEYVRGSMEGEAKTYYESGQLRDVAFMVKNEENGPFKEYHENGKLKAEGTYIPSPDGPLEQGELKEYDENGTLIRKANCDRGVCNTTWSATAVSGGD